MVRVIKHGSNWKFKREAWYGKVVKCKDCGCEFKITEELNFHHTTGGRVARITYALCPECGTTENTLSWKD